jgi:hypothetical protein
VDCDCVELRQCGQKWLVILLVLSLNFAYQSEEEASSAEEQLASYKIDGYTIVRGVSNGSFTFTIGIHHS